MCVPCLFFTFCTSCVQIGSARLLTEPKVPGSKFKVLDQDGYDDGGVGDLTLLIDLEDRVLRRKRGDNAYFSAVRSDVLPRVTTGPLSHLTRREQKIELAKLLFSDGDVRVDDDEDNSTPSEVYMETVGQQDDEELRKRRLERLDKSKQSLRLSIYLCEPACAAISLTEISKRVLLLDGKDGAEVALRCASKAIEVASDQYYDSDLIVMEVSKQVCAKFLVVVLETEMMECMDSKCVRMRSDQSHCVTFSTAYTQAEETPKEDPKYEKNATSAGLLHPNNLKYFPKRTAILCQRAGYLHRGNALSALGRHEEARESYEMALPLLETEPRSCRMDWERSSALVNIGNTYSRQGLFDKANEYYDKAEQLGNDHLEVENGNKSEGMGIKMVAMRARAFSLKKAGKEEDAKTLLREVLKMQVEFNDLMQKERAEMKAALVQDQANGVTEAVGVAASDPPLAGEAAAAVDPAATSSA